MTERETAMLGSGAMFDRIAPRYDLLNRVLSLGFDQSWRKRAVRALELGTGARVLDVATGTGDLAIAIARMHPGARVIGLDPSAQMLAIAETKVAKRGLAARVSLVQGDAQHLPQASCEVDAATIAFGIRNVPDRAAALRELARVVRPGGRIAVLELGTPRKGPLGVFARFHANHVVPLLGGWIGGSREYRYLQTSVAAFPPPDEFAALMRANGLTVVDVVPLMFGACTLYVATPTEES
jgi:demethylmenaquinone methyltransferase/2-methoxy-6-polyprenyl-1,4-benzoquinol methylase